jgi:hypothetical protein
LKEALLLLWREWMGIFEGEMLEIFWFLDGFCMKKFVDANGKRNFE